MAVDVLLLSPGPLPAALAGLDATHVRTGDGVVLPDRAFDVAVATSWEATAHLFTARAQRFAFWVDGFAHHRLGSWQAERIAAALAYDLPTDFLAAGRWVADELAALRPEARVLTVLPGVARGAVRGAVDGPLRVAVDDAWLLEGAASEAHAALATMAEPHVVAERAEDADVLLCMNPVDGVLGTPLQAAGAGCVPLVVASAGGAEELVAHLETGIQLEPDDVRGTARWLDHLARDRELLARLRVGALATAAAYPTPEKALGALQDALREIVDTPPPADLAWPRRLMADAMAAVAVHRSDHYILAEELRRAQGDEAYVLAQKVRAKLDSPKLRLVRCVVRVARRRPAPPPPS